MPNFKIVLGGQAFNSEASELIAAFEDDRDDTNNYLYKSRVGAYYTYVADVVDINVVTISPANPEDICEFLQEADKLDLPLYTEMFARVPKFGSQHRRVATTLREKHYKRIEEIASKREMTAEAYINKFLVEGSLSV
jgi:hypothetical protein